MKLTPLDIHHKEFRRALRGYDEKQVDDFLDEVADELERLFKENIDQNEKLDAMRVQVREWESQRETLTNAIVAAQRSAEEIVMKSRAEAADILRDAELKAKELIHNALQQKQKVAGELIRIKQAEEEFRTRFRGVLEQHIRTINEIPLSEDVTVLLGHTDDGVVGDVTVGAAQSAPPMRQAAPTPMPVAPAPAPVPEAPAPLAAEEPPAPLFIDPDKLPIPSFGALGEREDDLEIEEID